MIVDDTAVFRSPQVEKLSLPFAKFCLQKADEVPHIYMVRLDRVAPYASGNKIYKLYGFLEYARREGLRQLLSFGGAWSNHIHALALTARHFGFTSVGVIRGEPANASNAMLTDAVRAGMVLRFVDHKSYRQRHEPDFLAQIQSEYPEALMIAEGGAGSEAMKGCSMIPEQINQQMETPPSVMACACGTGTTAAGITHGLQSGQKLYAYPVLRDPTIELRIKQLQKASQPPSNLVEIIPATGTAFARINKELLSFVLDWLDEYGILLDPVYTAKMCHKIVQQINAGEFADINSLAIIHSGGLQGWRGMELKVIELAGESAWSKIEKAMRGEMQVQYPLYLQD